MTKPMTAFERILIHAENELWLDFQKASEYKQNGDIGTSREDAVMRFLKEHLPNRYEICSGEVVDSQGNQSGQIDLMIFDSSTTCPLMTTGKDVLLPAEALLAVVEVKTTLSMAEIEKSLKGIKKIHTLKPWGDQWSVSRKNGSTADDALPRVLTSIFAYESNLGSTEWAAKEIGRVREQTLLQNSSIEYVDRVAVLNRGFLMPSAGKAVEPREQSGVLNIWFFSLVNFLDREVRRRKAFPWDDYQIRDKKIWKRVLPELYDAPEAGKLSQYRRKQNILKAAAKK
jgi:hypothetical protein